MTIPLIILAVLSAIGGFIGIPELFSGEGGNSLTIGLNRFSKMHSRKLAYLSEHIPIPRKLSLWLISIIAAVSGNFILQDIFILKKLNCTNSARNLKGCIIFSE